MIFDLFSRRWLFVFNCQIVKLLIYTSFSKVCFSFLSFFLNCLLVLCFFSKLYWWLHAILVCSFVLHGNSVEKVNFISWTLLEISVIYRWFYENCFVTFEKCNLEVFMKSLIWRVFLVTCGEWLLQCWGDYRVVAKFGLVAVWICTTSTFCQVCHFQV